ncbi:hypothetical protein [Saccharopolyspora elongata]|uniref:Uncharacterized protein n=1 Tax=Saccharopolyspora elongata TaxID=2530387 RepID=A0A4R4YDL9_9PSEU|nr:hypothetical protein [Saccharopolyspora elongata]TDD41919.1 hypothetical protein E1288_31175 [Saccharopolyspora elongata]
MRYGLRVLALVVVVAAGVGLGIWWNRPPEVRSSQEVAALLPSGGDGFRAQDEDSFDRGFFLAAVEDCAPVPAVQQFRTASSAVFKGYTIGEENPAQVAIVQLQSMHDMACQDRMDAVLAAMSAPLVVDDGVATDGLVDVDDPAGFARILETRGVYRNGAVTYRHGDSALVFSTFYDPLNPPLGWDAYVRHCSTAEPGAARLCEPDPFGPLGGADWTAVLAERGCDEEYEAIVHGRFQDLTGDGLPEAVLAVSCDLADGTSLREVQVYDGGSPPDSPRLIQALLGDDPGPQGTGLAPATVTLSGDELTVQSWSRPPGDPQGEPNLLVTDGFRWQDGNFVPEWRDVEDVS